MNMAKPSNLARRYVPTTNYLKIKEVKDMKTILRVIGTKKTAAMVEVAVEPLRQKLCCCQQRR